MTEHEVGRAEVILAFRQQMARWGQNLDHLSDEEIEAGAAATVELARKFGVTTEQAVEAAKVLAGILTPAGGSEEE